MFDVLPRIEIAKNTFNLDEIDFFLFPNVKYSFQKQTLDLLNIPDHKRLSGVDYRHIECSQIIATDHPYVIKDNASAAIQDLPKWIILWLRKNLTKDVTLKDSNSPEKVYLDRSDASPNIKKLRKIINEDEVITTLKEKDFKVIKLSDFSFIDQMKIFYNAKKIIGLHGAGFANVLFSQSDLKVLEIKPISAGKLYENLAIKCNVNYDCLPITPEKFHNDNQMGHVRVNIKKLIEKL